MALFFDQNSSEFKRDPYSYLNGLRERADILPAIGSSTHVVLSYELVKKVISDTSLSVKYIPKHMSRIANSDVPTLDILGKFAIVFTDPPQHQRLRKLHMNVFNSRVIDSFKSVIEDDVSQILDNVELNQEINIVNIISDKIPRTVLSNLLGVKSQFQDEIVESLLNVRTLLEPTSITPRKLRRLELEFEKCTEMFQKMIDQYRETPERNLLSLLMDQGSDAEKLTDHELQVSCALTFIAGHETTKALISSSAKLFAENPDQWDRIKSDRSLFVSTVDEIARLEPPLHFTTRLATRDFNLGKREVLKGDLILLCIASANRDPNVFEDPNKFNVSRERIKNLSFGVGMHNCIGRHLAHTEVKLLFDKMIERNIRFIKGEGYTEQWSNQGPTTRSLDVLKMHLG